jgi:plasmid replication initiation protein
MQAKILNPEHDQIQIRQHNMITSARHELSAVQLDIYFMLLSRLRPGDNSRYEISVREIEDLTGRQWNYQQLRDATGGLIGKVFEIEEEDGLLQVALMSSAKYLKGQGRIQLTIAEEIKPYLVDIKKNFTGFQLFCVLSMTSKYAKWLYVQFSRWKDLGFVSYELEDLKFKLNLKDPKGKQPEQYKQWGQFKDNVLEPTIRQINESSDLRVGYEVEKRGKSIHKLHFTIKHIPQFQTVIPFELADGDREAISLKARMYGIGLMDNKIVNQILESPELRKKALKALYDIALRKSSLSNPAGYFRTTMGV